MLKIVLRTVLLCWKTTVMNGMTYPAGSGWALFVRRIEKNCRFKPMNFYEFPVEKLCDSLNTYDSLLQLQEDSAKLTDAHHFSFFLRWDFLFLSLFFWCLSVFPSLLFWHICETQRRKHDNNFQRKFEFHLFCLSLTCVCSLQVFFLDKIFKFWALNLLCFALLIFNPGDDQNEKPTLRMPHRALLTVNLLRLSLLKLKQCPKHVSDIYKCRQISTEIARYMSCVSAIDEYAFSIPHP